jgi:WD40 repeat protein
MLFELRLSAKWSAENISHDVGQMLVNIWLPNRLLSTDKAAHQWDIETNQPIGTPLHHEDNVNCVTFSADGKFLVTGCSDSNYIYTWYVSAIIKKAGLLSNILHPIFNRTDNGFVLPG